MRPTKAGGVEFTVARVPIHEVMMLEWRANRNAGALAVGVPINNTPAGRWRQPSVLYRLIPQEVSSWQMLLISL